MKDVFKKVLALGFGISNITQQQFNKFAREVMKKQGISQKEADKLARTMMKKSKEVQKKVSAMAIKGAYSAITSSGVMSRKELNKFRKQIFGSKKKTVKKKKK